MISIPSYNSSGADGFGSGFFIACWDLVKEDLLEVAQDFFEGAALPRLYTFSYIVLITKVMNPTSFEKFRTTSLCSVVYEIFSNIIFNCMTSCLNRIIAPEQCTFLPGRSIFENITLTKEMVKVLNRKHAG